MNPKNSKKISSLLSISMFLLASLFFARNISATTPNDEYANIMWGFVHEGVYEANDMSTGKKANGKKIIVAVIDSTIDINHEDLSINLWKRSECFDWNNNPISGGCNKGGFDVVNKDDDPSPPVGSSSDHGTHVSGTVGAVTSNSIGVPGVAPEIEIMPLRVETDTGRLDSEAIVNAIHFAVNNGANIINMSLGGPVKSLIQRYALIDARNAGVLVVAAAGNHGVNNDKKWYKIGNYTGFLAFLNTYYNEDCVWKSYAGRALLPGEHTNTCTGGTLYSERYMYPASYDLENILSIAAMCPPKKWSRFYRYTQCSFEASDPDNNIANFSDYGLVTVDIGAPGVEILSTIPSKLTNLEIYSKTYSDVTREVLREMLIEVGIDPDEKPGYFYSSGTSMASPFAAGVAALVWSMEDTLTYNDVKNIIMETGIDTSSLAGKTVSGKRINALNAVSKLYVPKADNLTVVNSVDGSPINDPLDTTALQLKFKTTMLDSEITINEAFLVNIKLNGSPLSGFPKKLAYQSAKEEYSVPFTIAESGNYEVTITPRSKYQIEKSINRDPAVSLKFSFDKTILLTTEVKDVFFGDSQGRMLPSTFVKKGFTGSLGVNVNWNLVDDLQVRSKDVFNVVVTKNNTIVNERRVSGTTKSDFDITESGYYIARVSSVDEARKAIVKTTSLIVVLIPSSNENDYLLYGVPKQYGVYNAIITATDEFDAKTESSLALNVVPVCGDGIMQASNSEVCDGFDGLEGQGCVGVNNNVLCNSTCSAMYCSNGGVVYAGVCGDAVRQGPEICDTGKTGICNTSTGYKGTELCAAGCAAWSNECTSALFCGDRIVNGPEQCEAPGNGTGPNNQYACTNYQWAGGYGGDGIVNGPEQCEPNGFGTGPDDQYVCTNYHWTGGYCGDSSVQYQHTEQCETPGNGTGPNNQYACTNCQWTGGWRGDGIKNGPEECEPNGFGTGPDDQYVCTNYHWTGGYCGDSSVQYQHSEQCEAPGNGTGPNNQYACTNCRWTGGYGGDGIVNGPEQCEAPGSGASVNNQYACTNYQWAGGYRGDRIVNGPEECEIPGNGTGPNNQYACTNYQWAGGYGGDGIVNGPEQCEPNGFGTGPDDQYVCTNYHWTGGYCGDSSVQYQHTEQCETPGNGTGPNNQYACTNCQWTGGWRGDGIKNGPEECEPNGFGTGPDDQYVCTNYHWTGGYCGDSSVQYQHSEQCEAPGNGTGPNNQYACTNCRWTGGYGGDGIVNGPEQCEAPGSGASVNNQYACTNYQWAGGYCGDSVGQGVEACDGSDLKGQTCALKGFSEGTLTCKSGCAGFNTSGCYNTATLTGNVKAVLSGANIDGATITVAGKTATTDAAGNFSITDLQTNATYTATVVASEFANNTSYSFNFTGATNIEPYLFPTGWPGGVLAVVTRWNGKPTDLDLYMAKDTNESISLPYNTATAGGEQANYYNTVPQGGMVSNGDMFNSVGQEMITITAVDTSKIYHAYAKDASSLQGYDANVRALVFDGTGRLIKTLNGASQPTSKHWNPFKITFTSATNFTVTDVNTYSN